MSRSIWNFLFPIFVGYEDLTNEGKLYISRTSYLYVCQFSTTRTPLPPNTNKRTILGSFTEWNKFFLICCVCNSIGVAACVGLLSNSVRLLYIALERSASPCIKFKWLSQCQRYLSQPTV